MRIRSIKPEWMIQQDKQYKVADYLSAWAPEVPTGFKITGWETLMQALVYGVTPRGLYYANPSLLAALTPWDKDPDVTGIEAWRDDLAEWGEIKIKPLARDCFSGREIPVLEIQDRRRFWRWRERQSIPSSLRSAVYKRDGRKCVVCGATDHLTLDHIIPFSKGGPDTFENLQTMCQSCNSKKGASMPHVAER